MTSGFFQGGFEEGASRAISQELKERGLSIQAQRVQSQQAAQMGKSVAESIRNTMGLIQQMVANADAAGIARDDPVLLRGVQTAADQMTVIASQAQRAGVIPGLTPEMVAMNVRSLLNAPTPDQLREAKASEAGAVAEARARGTAAAQPRLVDVFDESGNVIGQQDPNTGRRFDDPTAPDLLTPEEEAQKVRIATRVASAQAAASPANSLIRVMQEERIAKIRQEREEADLRIKKREREEADAVKRVAKLKDATKNSANRQIHFLDKSIDLIESNVGVAGFLGEQLKNIAGTDARTLRELITTLQARIAFDELNTMRSLSETGGALGQVAIREIELLQATLGSIDQGQLPEVLLERLREIREHYSNIGALLGPDAATQVIQNPTTGEVRVLRDGEWQPVAQ